MDSITNIIYEDRLLVFIEDINKGTFRQVLLNQEQFRKVSDAVVVEEKDGMARVKEGKKEIPSDTFIGMESIYETL